MSAIAASFVRAQTMADGTLRLIVDVEPRDAVAAFGLFGQPGTAMALAALKPEFQVNDEAKPEESGELKGGALARLAGMWCESPDFWAWLETDPQNAAKSSRGAAACVYAICDITSRVELDHDQQAAEKFQRLIRGPFIKYLASLGLREPRPQGKSMEAHA